MDRIVCRGALLLAVALVAGCARCDPEPAPPAAAVRAAAPPAREGPAVGVAVAAPGYAPPEVEALVVGPLEARLAGLPGVAGVDAVAAEGGAQLTARFAPGVPPDAARRAVVEALAAAAPTLPEDVEPPLVHAPAVADAAWFAIAAADRPPVELGALAETVRTRLLAVPRVAAVELCGAPQREVRVGLDPDRLAALGVSAADVARALSEAAADLPAGTVLGGAPVRVRGAAPSVTDLAGVVVAARDGAVVRLADVATVEDAAATDCVCRSAAGAAACGRVRVSDEAAAGAVRAAVRERIADTALPGGVRVDVLPPAVRRFGIRLPEAPADGGAHAARLAETLAQTAGGQPWLLLAPARRGPGAEDALLVTTPAPAALAALAAVPGVAVAPYGTGALVLRVSGPDLDRLQRHAAAVAAAVRAVPGVAAVRVDGGRSRPTVSVVTDRERLAQLGLHTADVAAAAALALEGREVATLSGDGGRVPVRLVVGAGPGPGPAAASAERLAGLRLASPGGASVPLSAVARIELSLAPEELHHRDLRRVVAVHVWGADGASAAWQDAAERAARGAAALTGDERLDAAR